MSVTRIMCETCGRAQCYCSCPKPNAPSSLAEPAGYATVLWDISSWGNDGAVLMVRVGNCSLTEHIIQAINGGATTIVIASAVKERIA